MKKLQKLLRNLIKFSDLLSKDTDISTNPTCL